MTARRGFRKKHDEKLLDVLDRRPRRPTRNAAHIGCGSRSVARPYRLALGGRTGGANNTELRD